MEKKDDMFACEFRAELEVSPIMQMNVYKPEESNGQNSIVQENTQKK